MFIKRFLSAGIVDMALFEDLYVDVNEQFKDNSQRFNYKYLRKFKLNTSNW